MIKIAVCDDEKGSRTYLAALIKKQNIECSIREYASAEEYLSDRKPYDLLFLDIEMGGSSEDAEGMALARRIRGTEDYGQPLIIFVTGYEQYVYDAFDVGAFQYLLKPVDEQRFAEVFGRAAGQILSGAEQCGRKLTVRHAGEEKAIPLCDIYYIESRNHNIVLCTKGGRLECYGKIGALEEELRGQFYRIHRGYLLNLSYVEGYDRTEVSVTNGEKLLLSRYKYEGFVQAYLDYISEEGQ